ncbi:MAG TPA: type II secretion system protein GspK [Usitatibacter sp.]|nr:type II secretion system protein GspK [Usitatibacter sp.]
MWKPERRSPRGAQGGFVLATTVWLLAAIVIGAAFFAERVQRSRDLTRQHRQMAQSLIVTESTRSEVLFRLATTDVSIYGLGPPGQAIALDDRAYKGTGDDSVRLQDERGLLNVNFPDSGMMSQLLGQFGVPPDRRDPLIDTLRDYTDVDDFRRLNGAEAKQYEEQGLPPPPNDWLTTPYELRNIIGWRDQPGLWKTPRFLQVVSAARLGVFNPNTAPAEVLASLPGSNMEIAARLIQQRNLAPLTSWQPIADLTGFMPADQESIAWTPAEHVRITQKARGLPWMLQFSVSLTPTSAVAPWRIDYYVRGAIDVPLENEKDIASLPPRVAQPAAEAEAF